MSKNLNIGARLSSNRKYDLANVLKDGKDFDISPEMRADLLRMCTEAQEWYDNRGNIGDGVDECALSGLKMAIRAPSSEKSVENALVHAVLLASGKMHPTARDIVTEVCEHLVYNACGARLYTYRTDN